MLCAVDIGTTKVKTLIVDDSGRRLAFASEDYSLVTSRDGVVEQRADSWWELTCRTVRNCITQLAKPDVSCICISAQGGSMVPVDTKGDPVALAATWMDTRNADFITRLTVEYGQEWFLARIGRKLSSSSGIAHVKTFLDLNPDRYLTTLEFMNLKLTGQAVTDPTSAAMTGLYDVIAGNWQQEILNLCGICEKNLPVLMPSGAIIGNVTPSAAEALGLPASALVVNGGHDQACAAAGAGVLAPGDVLLSTGTAWVVYGVTRKIHPNTRFSNGPHVIPQVNSILASVPTGGASLDWVRGKLMGEKNGFADIDRETVSRMGRNSRLLVRPFFSSGRASIEGLDLNVDKYDIALATMEGVVFEIRHLLDLLTRDDIPVNSVKLIGGAANAAPWQDLVRTIVGDVYLYSEANIAGVGAAALGGVALAVWPSLGQASAALCEKRFCPAKTGLKDFYDEKYSYYFNWRNQSGAVSNH